MTRTNNAVNLGTPVRSIPLRNDPSTVTIGALTDELETAKAALTTAQNNLADEREAHAKTQAALTAATTTTEEDTAHE